eukprot:GFKZ01013956.1.p2 GENE.GFKZ01013956.1~~GFKZ01013956.1.p2  ORF type:complete len:125 (+),score=11.81 GFKZ01013956.1:511-885(+)
MVIREYRIPFPATVEEYRIGMLYMISRATEEERVRRGGGAVIDVVKQERYYDSDRGIHGVYTEKVWHVGQMLPGFMRVWIPEAKSILIEKVCMWVLCTGGVVRGVLFCVVAGFADYILCGVVCV